METSGDECVPLKEVTDLFEADQGISVVHQRQTHTLKRGMDESGQKDQQIRLLVDKCQEMTQAQKDVVIQLLEANETYQKNTRNTRYNASENNFRKSQGLTRKERR